MRIITRSQWRAGPHRAGTIRTPTSRLFLHHTVTARLIGAAAGRELQRIARQRGFLDISYSFLVDVRGNVIEGRGAGRLGGHTRGYNSTSHAISLVGNFHTTVPPEAMLQATAELVAFGHRNGWWPSRITHTHSQVSATACAGRHANARVPDINRRAGRILSGSSTPVAPRPIEEDEEMILKPGDRDPFLQTVKRQINILRGEWPNATKYMTNDDRYDDGLALQVRRLQVLWFGDSYKSNKLYNTVNSPFCHTLEWRIVHDDAYNMRSR